MSDLRALPHVLAGRGEVTTPPYAAVLRHAQRVRARRMWAIAAAVVTLGLALAGTTATLGPTVEERREWVGDDPPPTITTMTQPAEGNPEMKEGSEIAASPPGPGSPSPVGGGNQAAPGSAAALSSSLECRAEGNGGATGPGVTATTVHLLGGAQLDGPTKTITEDAPLAWKAVFDKVNRAGGICGRRIDLRVVNGLFRRSQDFGTEDVAGMLAGPLDRDLDARLSDGSIDRRGVPVVGSDGSGRPQFFSAWNWAVGAPTTALVRIGTDEAYRGSGARTFALVYDNNFGVGVERAFSQYVGALPGATVKAVQALDPADPSYADEANGFNQRCRGSACDAVILALQPETLKKWWQANPERAGSRTAVVGLPVSERTGQDCARLIGSACDDIRVWTPFTPPIAPFLDDPDVREYADDVGNPGNTATTTAYVGAKVMVAALRQAGPHLTRASLKTALDAVTFSSGLVSTLDWGPRVPLDRAGNAAARALRPETVMGTFRRWVDAGTGWVRDPQPGHFPE